MSFSKEVSRSLLACSDRPPLALLLETHQTTELFYFKRCFGPILFFWCLVDQNSSWVCPVAAI
jgi:hypothetical protein